MNTREQFEAAWRKEYPLHSSTAFTRSGFDPERYANTRVQDGWLMWQASRATPADHRSLTTEEIQLAVKVWRERRTRMPDIAVQEAFTDGLAAASALFKRRATPADHIGDAAEKVDADSVPVAMDATRFACYLIDHCEDAYVSEERVQAWLASAMKDPQYAAPQAPQKVSDSVRDAVIEECLKACREQEIVDPKDRDDRLRNIASEDCWRAIRSLKSAPPQKPVSEEVKP